MKTRRLMRADRTGMDLPDGKTLDWLRDLIGARTVQVIRLRHWDGHVLMFDNEGLHKRLPVNDRATRLYRFAVIQPTLREIRGDAVIYPDEAFSNTDPPTPEGPAQ